MSKRTNLDDRHITLYGSRSSKCAVWHHSYELACTQLFYRVKCRPQAWSAVLKHLSPTKIQFTFRDVLSETNPNRFVRQSAAILESATSQPTVFSKQPLQPTVCRSVQSNSVQPNYIQPNCTETNCVQPNFVRPVQ